MNNFGLSQIQSNGQKILVKPVKDLEELFLNLQDVTVCYNDIGSGDVPIIFIHGLAFDKSMWSSQLSALSKSHRVIAYDIRGFGSSNSTDQTATVEVFADDLIHMMDGLHIESAVLCGLSMGGYVALEVVRRYSSRVRALVLCDTQCERDTAEAVETRSKNSELILGGGLVEYCEALLRRVFSKKALTAKPRLVERMRKVVLSTSIITLANTLAALALRQDLTTSIRLITAPTMILCGRHDVVITPTQSETLFAGINGSSMHIIEDAGHLPNLEKPQAFNTLLTDFLHHLR